MNYLGIALAFFCVFQAECSATLRKSRYRPTESGPQIIIATNLEHVLISKDWFSMISSALHHFYQADNKVQLLKLITNFSFWHDCYLTSCRQLMNNEGKRLLHQNEYVAYFAQKYPALASHHEELLDLLHEYAIDEEMIAFYLWLKISKNYALFIATNKNRASMKIIKKKLNEALQKKFGISWRDLFDGEFYVDKIDPITQEVFTKEAKPSIDYFQGLWHYLCYKLGCSESNHLMYIDDAEPNILAAQAAHHEFTIPIDGVYFQRPEQIKHAVSVLAESLEKRIREN